MNPNFLNAALVICVFSGAAQASTLRVTCDDGAAGAAVSVNGKFKGECPVDIQVAEGKVVLKATKSIDGKKKGMALGADHGFQSLANWLSPRTSLSKFAAS